MVYFDALDDVVKSASIDAFISQLKEFGCEIIESDVQNKKIKFKLPPIADKIKIDISRAGVKASGD